MCSGETTRARKQNRLRKVAVSSYFQPAGGNGNLSDIVDIAFFTVRDRKTHLVVDNTRHIYAIHLWRVHNSNKKIWFSADSFHYDRLSSVISDYFCTLSKQRHVHILLVGTEMERVSVGYIVAWNGRLLVSAILSVAIKSTVMLSDRLLSLMGGINKNQWLEWTKGDSGREYSIELDGRGPFIEIETKISHYSQHCLSKDLDNVTTITMIIDCMVEPAFILEPIYSNILKDLSVYQLLPLQTYVQPRHKLFTRHLRL